MGDPLFSNIMPLFADYSTIDEALSFPLKIRSSNYLSS